LRSRSAATRLIMIAAVVLLLAFPSVGCLTTASTAEEAPAQEDRAADLEAQLLEQVEYFRQNSNDLVNMIHQAINEKRQENGLQPLKWDPHLADIALSHSRDMAERDYFDHVSPEGDDFADRYEEKGYTKDTRVGNQVYLGGENLFLNNVVESYTYDESTREVLEYNFNDIEELVLSTVNGWMDSPGHRDNILTPFSREGIGIYITDEGKVYITENFS
jgi:uncharacterized protein YkwD